MGEERNEYGILMRKPEGNMPLRKPRRRWDGVVWTGFIWVKIGTCGGLL
jgi:hypothetical protein